MLSILTSCGSAILSPLATNKKSAVRHPAYVLMYNKNSYGGRSLPFQRKQNSNKSQSSCRWYWAGPTSKSLLTSTPTSVLHVRVAQYFRVLHGHLLCARRKKWLRKVGKRESVVFGSEENVCAKKVLLSYILEN